MIRYPFVDRNPLREHSRCAYPWASQVIGLPADACARTSLCRSARRGTGRPDSHAPPSNLGPAQRPPALDAQRIALHGGAVDLVVRTLPHARVVLVALLVWCIAAANREISPLPSLHQPTRSGSPVPEPLRSCGHRVRDRPPYRTRTGRTGPADCFGKEFDHPRAPRAGHTSFSAEREQDPGAERANPTDRRSSLGDRRSKASCRAADPRCREVPPTIQRASCAVLLAARASDQIRPCR